ncbi:hypothetical protein PR202_gb10317 [Eleusine coracana subsp. coracana]|uniref:Uncharacterized protein n=1 Tax=Eleusine coracana subsp. coracana TaxID=191504 RepID=A0AAV5EJL8_ELECO|nr:hypothetical protein PR202_gb10317 [Eleusine coracana subsp. coracana]
MDPGAPARPEQYRGPPGVRAVAAVLAAMGCASAVLAHFAMTLEPAVFHAMVGSHSPPSPWLPSSSSLPLTCHSMLQVIVFDSVQQGGRCALTAAETVAMRAGASLLLLSAASQVLAAAWARCVPSRVLLLLAVGFAAVTVYRVAVVVPAVVVAAAGQPTCHARGFQDAFAVHYLLLVVLLCVPLLGAVVAACIKSLHVYFAVVDELL